MYCHFDSGHRQTGDIRAGLIPASRIISLVYILLSASFFPPFFPFLSDLE